MPPSLRPVLRPAPATGLLLTLLALATVAALAWPQAALAETRPMPGRFTGHAFDACQAPDQATMDAWREASPYWAVGIYTSGVNRYCDEQQHLSADWVATQARRGWRLLPIHVGLQAACRTDRSWLRIDDDPADGYAAARAQGRAEAQEAVAAARALGLGEGSTLWYDLEHFDSGDAQCRESALSLVSAWTRELHRLDFRSGFYSSASSGIRMVDDAWVDSTDDHALPDRIWIAHYDGQAGTSTRYISDEGWARERMKQYRGTHLETYGGFTVSIDSNFVDVAGGSRAGRPAPHCGVEVDFLSWPTLHRGDRGGHVAAAQCFLRRQGFYGREVDGRFDRPTRRAVLRLQRAVPGLRVSGVVNRRTWTALLSAGRDPLVKYGAAGDAVRRLQRALNAAIGTRVEVTGVFEATTEAAVRAYQDARGLPGTGVAAAAVWAELQAGRR